MLVRKNEIIYKKKSVLNGLKHVFASGFEKENVRT
jgi:hypothetical protein